MYTYIYIYIIYLKFAHAQFVSESIGLSVNMDDPNFWAKMLPEVPQ